jgi:hypothetical protein
VPGWRRVASRYNRASAERLSRGARSGLRGGAGDTPRGGTAAQGYRPFPGRARFVTQLLQPLFPCLKIEGHAPEYALGHRSG